MCLYGYFKQENVNVVLKTYGATQLSNKTTFKPVIRKENHRFTPN